MAFWTHASVVELAGDRDPIEVLVDRARRLALEGIEAGWDGPPFDPIFLADHLGIPVDPRDDVYDSRLVPDKAAGPAGVRIEFNPNRPKARQRFSLSHEIAHLLFPDHAEAIRNRAEAEREVTDDWQLEMLCNIAAGELLMPAASLADRVDKPLDIREVLALRAEYEVSVEAVLMRAARLSPQPIAVFAASRVDPKGESDEFRLDYAVPSRAWSPGLIQGAMIPRPTCLSECTAVGWTAIGESERWPGSREPHRVDCVGVPPYPGHLMPRVVGLLSPSREVPQARSGSLRYVIGDATQPRGTGARIIAHVVNTGAGRWGPGFAGALTRAYPDAAATYSKWADDRSNLELGRVHVIPVGDGIDIASLVAQEGFGPAREPRIRYWALEEALDRLGAIAAEKAATIHMPRIGTGHGGGSWPVIERLVVDALVGRGLDVVVYDPTWAADPPRQQELPLQG